MSPFFRKPSFGLSFEPEIKPSLGRSETGLNLSTLDLICLPFPCYPTKREVQLPLLFQMLKTCSQSEVLLSIQVTSLNITWNEVLAFVCLASPNAGSIPPTPIKLVSGKKSYLSFHSDCHITLGWLGGVGRAEKWHSEKRSEH